MHSFSLAVLDDKNIYCENGQTLSIYRDFCHENKVCPIHPYSSMALKSNCSQTFNHFCPTSEKTSKICMDKLDVSITTYCSNSYMGQGPWKCPKANKGLNFEQCYDK